MDTATMGGPVAAWRRAHGWTRRDLAQAAGCGYATAANAELGVPATVPMAVLDLAERVDGPDVADGLRREYGAWRRAVGDALLAGAGGRSA